MLSADLQIGVAALLEQCAQQRAGIVPPVYQDDSMRLTRMLQAEAAGRELMAALVRPDPYPDISLGAVIRRLLGYIETVISASTPDEQLAPLLTVCVRHVSLGADTAQLLRDAAILLVLTALDDGAQNVDVRLDNEDRVRLSVESDRPGVVDDLPTLQLIRGGIIANGGEWTSVRAAHGGSWMVSMTMPCEQACDMEANCGN